MMANPNNDATNQRTVLLVGETDRDEMRSLVHWLHQLVAQSCRLICCRNLEAAETPHVRRGASHYSPKTPQHRDRPQRFFGSLLDWLSTSSDIADTLDAQQDSPSTDDCESLLRGEIPDLIVVLQSEADEYSALDVSGLLECAPLARVVVCCGEWCESIGRNRDVWPLSIRVPLWAARNRIEREWQLIQDPNAPNPPPWSASREEVFADELPSTLNWLESETVAIESPDSSYHRYLLELMTSAGIRTGASNVSVLLFDADPWNPSRAESLERCQVLYPQATVIALVDQINTTGLLGTRATEVVQKLGFHRQFSARCTNSSVQ